MENEEVQNEEEVKSAPSGEVTAVRRKGRPPGSKNKTAKKTRAPKEPKDKKVKQPRATRLPEALVSPEDYLVRIKKNVSANLKPGDISKLIQMPEYQREVIPAQVRRLRIALRQGEILPDIILAKRVVTVTDPATGEIKQSEVYKLCDGFQRVTAALAENMPLRATIVDFGTIENERKHFVNFQKVRRVNNNLLIRFSEDPVSQEVVRVSKLPNHPWKDHIWLGRDDYRDDMLAASALVSLTKKGLKQEELEDYSWYIGRLFPLTKANPIWKSGGLRGTVNLYRYLKERVDYTAAHGHEGLFANFDFSTIADVARINSAEAGQTVGNALIAHFSATFVPGSEPVAPAAPVAEEAAPVAEEAPAVEEAAPVAEEAPATDAIEEPVVEDLGDDLPEFDEDQLA